MLMIQRHDAECVWLQEPYLEDPHIHYEQVFVRRMLVRKIVRNLHRISRYFPVHPSPARTHTEKVQQGGIEPTAQGGKFRTFFRTKIRVSKIMFRQIGKQRAWRLALRN